MKILICTVADDVATQRANQARAEALDSLLMGSKKLGVDLIVMPGGYFRASARPDIMAEWDQIKRAVESHGIATCFGVDTDEKRQADQDENVAGGRLPSFGYGWTLAQGWQGPWRQRSVTSAHSSLVQKSLAEEARFLRVGAKRVEVLICGELFNDRIRQAVFGFAPTAVVDMVHRGAGFRFHAAASSWSKGDSRRAVMMSCHVRRRNGAKRNFKDGMYFSPRDIHVCISAPVRIEGYVLAM